MFLLAMEGPENGTTVLIATDSEEAVASFRDQFADNIHSDEEWTHIITVVTNDDEVAENYRDSGGDDVVEATASSV